jgi:hypothetical protein
MTRVVAERGVLTAPAEARDLAVRWAEVIRRLAGRVREIGRLALPDAASRS